VYRAVPSHTNPGGSDVSVCARSLPTRHCTYLLVRVLLWIVGSRESALEPSQIPPTPCGEAEGLMRGKNLLFPQQGEVTAEERFWARPWANKSQLEE
jgi:hypothetical protein